MTSPKNVADIIKIYTIEDFYHQNLLSMVGNGDRTITQEEVDANGDGYLDCTPVTNSWDSDTFGWIQHHLFMKGFMTKLRLHNECDITLPSSGQDGGQA